MDKEGHHTHWTVPALPYKALITDMREYADGSTSVTVAPECVNHPGRKAVGLYKDGKHLCGACLDAKRIVNATDWDRYDGNYPTFCDQPYKPTGGRTT